MKRKLLLWSALLLLAAMLGAWLWPRIQPLPAPEITLPNGVTYRLAGVTCGTNHAIGLNLGRVVEKLPKPLQQLAAQVLGNRLGWRNARTTTQPSLCLWFEPLNTNSIPAAPALSLQAMLADANGLVAGSQESLWVSPGFPQWLSPAFSALPRRSRFLQCCLFAYGPDGKRREIGRVQLPNPLYGRFPQWEPEVLPAVKQTGGLTVRLEQFSTGHSSSSETVTDSRGKTITRFQPAEPGEEGRAAFVLTINSSRGTNELWTLHGAELSDATGNHLRAASRSESGDGRCAIAPVLWPDEAAWRFKVELRRKTGLAPHELLTFSNVPIPSLNQTNTPDLTRTLGGTTFTLKEFVRRPDQTNSSWSSSQASSVRVTYPKVPDGYTFDFLEARGDDGLPLEVSSRSWSGTSYEIHLQTIPAQLKRLDFTYAVQPVAAVEFLVRPEPRTE